MKGYYKRPEANAEAFKNGWFHSGDIGVFDEDGYLSIVDRKKEMILRGGYNIYPRELEEVIMTHPAVSLVAVIGVPCDKMGEEVKAFIVKKQGAGINGRRIYRMVQNAVCQLQIPAHGRIPRRTSRRRNGQDFKTRFERGNCKIRIVFYLDNQGECKNRIFAVFHLCSFVEQSL